MFSIFYFALLLPFAYAAQHELPKGLKRCRWDDPNISLCLQGAVGNAFKLLKHGAPELGLPNLDPLVIPAMSITQGSGRRPVSLDMKFKNLKIHGISQLIFKNYSANLKEARLISESFSSAFRLEADYTSSGKVLLLPLKGDGQCNLTLVDVVTKSDVTFKSTKKGKDVYWNIQGFKILLNPRRVDMYFSNLINTREKGINEGLNAFLNENWELLFEEMKPAFEEALGQIFKDITHRVFSKLPINKIFII